MKGNGTCCGLLDGVNQKRLAFTILALFGYIFASDFIIHQLILGESYKATASLWRPEDEMKKMCGWMLLAQIVIATFAAILFAKGYEKKGLMEGVRFGFLLGGYTVAPFLIQYVVFPIPRSIVAAWVVLGFVQVILGGVVAAAVYRK